MPDNNDSDDVRFSRGSKVELRGMSSRLVVDVLDAYSLDRRIDRMVLVNEILEKWVAEREHEATLFIRASRGNPSLSDADGGSSGFELRSAK